MEIQRQSRKTQRSTGKVPSEVWEKQLLKRTARLTPAPSPTLLDLHFSLAGRSYEIAPTSRKVVTVLFHPFRKLWVLDR